VLIVAVQVKEAGRGQSPSPCGDGVLTGRGTFQKFFGQGELKAYLEAELQAEAIPASLGIFYVFRDETLRQQFLANRFRRRAAAPRKRISELRFEEHRELLESFMAAIAELGRLPEGDEFSHAGQVIERFGSLKRAFALVRRVTGTEEWDAIRQRRTEDLLVYLALARFRKRPPLGQLPLTLQRDMRAFFGTYTKACRQADELLFKAGDVAAIDEACQRSPVGKLLPDDLYVHRSALDHLESLLRIYEGCGRAYLGEVEGANIIKIHRRSGKLSYLVYPDFDAAPHPALLRSIRLSLRTRQLDCTDYSASANPPVLHRKDSFLSPDHPLREKFGRLTTQEEKHGLLSETSTIGTRQGWEARLKELGLQLRGHRVIRLPACRNGDKGRRKMDMGPRKQGGFQYSSGSNTVVPLPTLRRLMTQSRLPFDVTYSLSRVSLRFSRLLLLILPGSSVASQPWRSSSAVSLIRSNVPDTPQSPRA
jgi:DNA phosphorothioation-associated putative methyltransferase